MAMFLTFLCDFSRNSTPLVHLAKNKKPHNQAITRLSSYPEDYLFSNQFMEDLGRIYRLKKVIPDPEMYASR